MDSYLSLDELFVSFPNQALKSGTRSRRRERDSDVFRETSGDRSNSYERAEGKGEMRSRNEVFTLADYVQANGENESYAGKLPSIRPVSARQRDILKKERNQEEFSCIDLDDFSGWKKPVTTNTRRVGKEGKKARNNSFNALDVYRPRQLSLGSSTDLHAQNAERRLLFSPSVTPKPESPEDLPEKFTRFLEREFSIIKGESGTSTSRTPFRSDSDHSLEREPLNSNSTERLFSSESVRKPMMGKANRNMKESRSKYNINARRGTLPSSRPRRLVGGAKWDSADSVAESSFVNKLSSDSPNLCDTSPAKLDLSRRTQSLPSERKEPFTASQTDMSPRSSCKEFEDRPLFSSSESRRLVQELPLYLPEKLTKFIEVEFSIIKGEDKSSTQKQKYGASAETEPPRNSPKEFRKSPSSLLQRRGREENDVH